jgi:mRNA interferase RelE/StbE
LGWTVEISDVAEKQLKKLDKPIQARIVDYLDDRLENCKNPRHFGEPLKANKSGLWRYRIGDYRVICEIQEHNLIVLTLAIGHRREIYRD